MEWYYDPPETDEEIAVASARHSAALDAGEYRLETFNDGAVMAVSSFFVSDAADLTPRQKRAHHEHMHATADALLNKGTS